VSSDGVDVIVSSEPAKRWCLFTSAGDRNAVRLWTDGASGRRWDLVVAYYGDDDREYAELSRLASRAFRSKGSKFGNLKKLVTQNPSFLDRYSYVWVCDDDIRIARDQIDELFAISEFFEFWVAQPSFDPQGKISHAITRHAGPDCDFRIVNFVEMNVPLFRRDKLGEFLDVYDGSLAGWGIDYWYMNLFNANEAGRFAVIDRVQVVNPHDVEKGGREIDRLQTVAERQAAWARVRAKNGLVEFPGRVFARCKIASDQNEGPPPNSDCNPPSGGGT
jgi:hypothetical protein